MASGSKYCPLMYYSDIDFDLKADLILKTGKKIYLDTAKTLYIVTADGTTFDFYVAGVKKGEISAAGFRAL